jgi:hypothetical protein
MIIKLVYNQPRQKKLFIRPHLQHRLIAGQKIIEMFNNTHKAKELIQRFPPMLNKYWT